MAALALAGCLGAGAAAAADGQGRYLVHGEGVNTCARYIEARGSNQPVEAYYYQSWLQGYLTGLNEQLSETYDILAGMNVQGALEWIAGWCRENPQATFYKAADALTLSRNAQRTRNAPSAPAGQVSGR